ncbi:hypothetical protein KYE_01703 [Marinobacter manganoxydans MnI7-9]|uniref:Uncharacterized protein n=1 Tax=Marinobacter manganoxydans MnI7-9 TaxID=1094979 RepID=G6YNC6_9GAMM|nr:hypothetical protein KYE_01703 [Marinobacter manganoxydans MnI7-9]
MIMDIFSVIWPVVIQSGNACRAELKCSQFFRGQMLMFHPHGTQPRLRQVGLSQHGIIWLSTRKGALG